MNTAQAAPAGNPGVEQALRQLKRAEVELLAMVGKLSRPGNALLLEAHAFLWEAISTLSRVAPSEPASPARFVV